MRNNRLLQKKYSVKRGNLSSAKILCFFFSLKNWIYETDKWMK